MTKTAGPYYGGKQKNAEWISSLLPTCRRYVEPFGGMMSVLLARPKPGGTQATDAREIYNDADGRMVNLFRTLQHPAKCEELTHRLGWTMHSRAEFDRALELDDADGIEGAWSTLVQLNQGFGGMMGTTWVSGGGLKNPGRHRLEALRKRIRHVVFEHLDWLDVVAKYDGPDTLFYLDPPYIGSARLSGHKPTYANEMTDDAEHRKLLHSMEVVEGAVAISGYPSELYEHELQDWDRQTKQTMAWTSAGNYDGLKDRTEVLWRNAKCVAWLRGDQPSLFDGT